MSDDEIKWESAFSDDSLDEVANVAADAADQATAAPDEREAEQPPDKPDPVPPIAEMTEPPVIEQPESPPAQTAAPDPGPPVPTTSQPAVPQAVTPTQELPGVSDFAPEIGTQRAATDSIAGISGDDPTDRMSVAPTVTPPQSSSDRPGRGALIKVMALAVAVLVPIAIAGFVILNRGSSFVFPDGINDVAADGALGSGCSLPSSVDERRGLVAAEESGGFPDEIPDGIWFALYEGTTGTGTAGVWIEFTISCAYAGENANAEAALRGETVEQPKIYWIGEGGSRWTALVDGGGTLIIPSLVADKFGFDSTHPVDRFTRVLGQIYNEYSGTIPVVIYVNDGELTEMVVQDLDALQLAGTQK